MHKRYLQTTSTRRAVYGVGSVGLLCWHQLEPWGHCCHQLGPR